MDLKHYLNIQENNFALNLGEDFYYYQNGKQNTLIHLPTQKEFHDIYNIRNDEPISIQLNKLINITPTINIDKTFIDENRLALVNLRTKYQTNILYYEEISLSLSIHQIRLTLTGFITNHFTYVHPIINFDKHTSPHFNYIWQNKLYVNNDTTTK